MRRLRLALPLTRTAAAAMLGLLLGACAEERRTYEDRGEPYRRTLQELVLFQQSWIREHGVPASPPFDGFEPVEPYVMLSVATTAAGGWAAVALDRRDPMWSCVYKSEFVSDFMETAGGVQARPGEVVCDEGEPSVDDRSPAEIQHAALSTGPKWPERMKLLELVIMQNAYRASHGRYASYDEIIGAGYRPEGMTFHVIEATQSGLAALTFGDNGQCMYWAGDGRPLLVDPAPELTAKVLCMEE